MTMRQGKQLTPAQRLIVAADFKPDAAGIAGLRSRVLTFADDFKDLGVCIKLNSAARVLGYGIIEEIHDLGIQFFADYKLVDISATLELDGMWLRMVNPDILTVMVNTGPDALRKLKEQLPNTQVLGVTVLTTFSEARCLETYGRSTSDAVRYFAQSAIANGLDGIICAPTDVPDLHSRFGDVLDFVTPNIRFKSEGIAGDDQNKDRSMSPEEAMRARASQIVMGRPITGASSPREAALRAIEEVKAGLFVA